MMADGSELRDLSRRILLQMQAISDHLESLAARDYPTPSPREFVVFLEKILTGLRGALEATKNPETARYLSNFSKELASHVRFLETASYPQVPWAFIGPMERLIKALIPNSRTVLRAQWEYNYKIRWISANYRDALDSLPRALLEDSLFADGVPEWNVVSLPVIERDNVIMHILLGHEVGHAIAYRFLDAEDAQAVQAAVQGAVGDGTWFQSDIDKPGPLFALQVKQALYDRILEMRNRALKELVSDLVGASLFGPALLFALREVALDDVLDALPAAPLYYPPWRHRLRAVWECHAMAPYAAALANAPGQPILAHCRRSLDSYLAEMATLVADRTDVEKIEADPITAKAYRLVREAMRGAPGFVAAQLGALAYASPDVGRILRELLARIAEGIPPAEAESGVVDFRDALLAGWFYRLGHFAIPFRATDGVAVAGTVEDDNTLNRLVHKAVEQIEVGQGYQAWRLESNARQG